MLRSHGLLRLAARPACLQQHTAIRQTIISQSRRHCVVLGIETSADDTCVALMQFWTSRKGKERAIMVSNEKVTCPNQKYKGIHPVEAVVSHTQNLSRMVSAAVSTIASAALVDSSTRTEPKPDLICVTRGPGMGGCLSVGVSTAKALSDVWNVPIVGVHHMQAHALSPIMEASLGWGRRVEYPFLTLLVSGKHTMLVHTKSPVDHRILVSIQNTIALGDVLDKVARELVPLGWYPNTTEAICYPLIMERQARKHFDNYSAPQTRQDELQVYQSEFGWVLRPPLRESKEMKYDFTALCSSALTILRAQPEMSDPERQILATHFMRLAFEHLMSRVIMSLETDQDLMRDPPRTLVMSGGVASNRLLRTVAEATLEARGFRDIKVACPRVETCTDNAAMIAYAGYKMYTDGWETDKTFTPVVKWSIEEILSGVDCWTRRPGFSDIAPDNVQGACDESEQAENEAAAVNALLSPKDHLPSPREHAEGFPGEALFFPNDPQPSRSETVHDEMFELHGEGKKAADLPTNSSEQTALNETLDSPGEDAAESATDEPFEPPGEEMDEADMELEHILSQAESILKAYDTGSHDTSAPEKRQAAQGAGDVPIQADLDRASTRNTATPQSAEYDKPPSRKSSPPRGRGADDKTDAKASEKHGSFKEWRQSQHHSASVSDDGAAPRKSPPGRDQAPPRAEVTKKPTATIGEAAGNSEPESIRPSLPRALKERNDTVSKQAAGRAALQPESSRARDPIVSPSTTTQADISKSSRHTKLWQTLISNAASTRDVPAQKPPLQMSSKKVQQPPVTKIWPVKPSEEERRNLKVRYLGFEDEPAPQKPAPSFMGRFASMFGLGRK